MLPLEPDCLALPNEIRDRLRDSADLAISISGGKDSDALALLLRDLHRREGWTGRLVLLHADLGRNEWSYTPGYVQRRALELHLPLHVVRREQGDLLSRWWQRHTTRPEVPPWSDARNRFCTSELKVAPIDRWLRTWKPSGTVICATGIRAAESPARAKKPVWAVRETISTRRRTGITWHPLHSFTTAEVWATLGISLDTLRSVREQVRAMRMAGDTVESALQAVHWRWHPAYALGNERLSCSLCVLASKGDLLNGAEHQPQHYRDLVDLELASGFSFRPGFWLADLRPDLLTEAQRQARTAQHMRPAPTVQPAPQSVPAIQLSLF